MRTLIREEPVGTESRAAGKPRAKETSASAHPSKAPRKTEKSAGNPNHREDFEQLLFKAATINAKVDRSTNEQNEDQ